MAQHDYVLSNQSGLAFRSDVNNALAAIVTQNSGAAQPSTTYAYMPWPDTTTGIFKIRNAANNGWISLFRLDGTFSFLPPEDGEVTLAKLADGVLAASAAGLLKMADGYLAASTAGRAKMADGFLTTAKMADDAVTPAKLSQPLTQVAAVTASGTAIDFTGIPSWVKRVTVMFNGVSTNGTSLLQLRVGSGAFVSAGYGSQAWTGSTGTSVATVGLVLTGGTNAANIHTGKATLHLVSNNQWAFNSALTFTNATSPGWTSAGFTPALGGALDRIRLITDNGADTFDAGSVGILYEG